MARQAPSNIGDIAEQVTHAGRTYVKYVSKDDRCRGCAFDSFTREGGYCGKPLDWGCTDYNAEYYHFRELPRTPHLRHWPAGV
jgi:hypothetical protein